MTRLELFQLMRPIILDVTGVPECILADPNEDGPTGSYCSVEPHLSITQRGQANDHSRLPDPNAISIIEDIRPQVVANCSVNFYRANANDYAQKLFQASKKTRVQEALFLAKVGWRNAGAVNNLTTLQSARQEERAQVSIYLMYEIVDTDLINTIEVVETTILDESNNVLGN